MRHGAALVVSHADTVTIVGADGIARRFEGASADLVRVALEFWSVPHTEPELVDHLRALAGVCDPALVAETAECLRAAGAIIHAAVHEASSDRRTAASARATRARVVLGISGAIAAIDAPALVRMLQARRFDVWVVMTPAARRFVSPGSLGALTHHPIIRTFWQKHGDGPAPHIRLAAWADVVVIYPATAATVARMAHAACTDVLSALVTATTRPVLVVPSMNESMAASPGVQRNLEQLRRDGRYVVEPVMGLEAAVAPSARVPMSGAAPPPSQVVAAIELLVEDAIGRRAAVAPVVGADAWDRLYESSALGELPWFTEQLDADLARELQTLKRGRLLDVGTGPGTTAIFAARSGFDVVATDVSSTALGVARRRANGERIAWVLDDFLDSRLWGRFDVLVNRGCLHCLPRTSWPDYARTAGRLVEPGGTLLLKVHAPEEAGRHGTSPGGPEELRAVFGEWFTLVATHASEYGGTIRPSPRALLVVLARTEPTGGTIR